MSNTKTTKRALLTSVVAIFLCVTMLIGTTFAWFTDTASTAVNKIQAGNLDIEVSYKDGDTWKSIQDEDSLFSSNLWEPGHTEVVYLKVTNAGTLGFNYKVLVTPVSESGGVNVNGQSFKLSDYLVFGTTVPSENPITYTRDEARNEVGTATGLKVNDLTKSDTILAGGNDKYMALVVYMPETVGNEANYKTGTAAPTIELGIKVVATQLKAENDSFGNNYDEGAVTDSFYTVGSYYNYFPQVSASAQVAESGNTVITASGKLNSTDTSATTLATVNVPAGAVKDGVTELNLSVKPVEATNSNAQTTIQAEVAAGREVANFDVKVDGIKDGNTANIQVEIFVGKGLSNVKVFHNGTEITGATYVPATGMVSFTTTSFSDFTVSYDPAVAAIGDKTYGSLELAVAAAENGDTIKLLKDVELDTAMVVPAEKQFILDLNGKSIIENGAGARKIVNRGKLTIKDSANGGEIRNTAVGEPGQDGAYGLIDNYGTLTIENGIFTDVAHGNGSSLRNRSGATLIINGGTFTNTADDSQKQQSGFTGAANAFVYSDGVDVRINGGIFTMTKAMYTPAIKIMGGTAIIDGATISTYKSGGIEVGSEVTIRNTNISVSETNSYYANAIAVSNDGVVNVHSGSFTGYSYGTYIYSSGGIINIYGGTFEAGTAVLKADNDVYDPRNSEINVFGGNFTGKYSIASEASLTISGGTFSSDPSAYVTKGYYTADTAAPFTVVECTQHTYQNGVCTKCDAKKVGANGDYNATIPEGATIISNQEDLNNALKAAAADKTSTLYVGEGTFSINNVDCDGKTIVFIGAGFDKTELQYGNTPASSGGEAGSNYTFEGSNVTFKDVTLKDVNGDNIGYDGFVRVKNMTFENCLLKSRMTYHGTDKAEFINCTFENLSDYSIWVYTTAESLFENCKFITAGKAILIYHEGGATLNEITVKDCVFTATKGAAAGAISNQNCAAIEIDNYGGAVNLTTSGNTADNHFSGEWRIKAYRDGKAITVNGTVYNKTALDGKLMTVTDKVAVFD